MEKLNRPAPTISAAPACLLDTDVIINWLTKEEDPFTAKELWQAPHTIIKLIEDGKIKGLSTLINLLEIRFVLRRKKGLSEDRIKKDIGKITQLLEIVLPDEVTLLKANSLQAEASFSPFDAILVATTMSAGETTLISRDKNLVFLAADFLPVCSPEEFLNKLNME